MGLSELRDSVDMFFIDSCAMVYHCVTDMMTIMATVTILTCVSELLMKEEDRLAPKTLEAWTCSASCCVSGPIEGRPYLPEATAPREASTRNRAKKMGICTRIGRQEAMGLVPCLR